MKILVPVISTSDNNYFNLSLPLAKLSIKHLFQILL